MNILKWGMMIFLTLIVPFLLGIVPLRYMNRFQRKPAMAYICGWFVSFSLFQVVAIPFIVFRGSFTTLVIVYSVMACVAITYSLFNLKYVKSCFKIKYNMPVWSIILWCIVIMLIGIQIYIAAFYEYYDGDDAYYIAVAVMSDTYDNMYIRDCYTGQMMGFDARHALAPMPIYQAWLSRISGIHVATIAHSVLSIVWRIVMYLVYELIAERLFAKNKKFIPVFMLFINVWFLFGNISLYTAETFAMTRIWQGKGFMAAVVVPVLFLCFLYLNDNSVSRGIWGLFIMTIVSSTLMTTISIMLVPTMVVIGAIIIGLSKKSIKRFFQIGLCCLPCIMIGIIYIFIK